MADVTDEEVEAKRQEVEVLREQVLVSRQDASARMSGVDNATTMEGLDQEAYRLRVEQDLIAMQTALPPEGGWPKPESPTEYVVPMGTLDEVPEEATPLYVPGPSDTEGPEGSTVTTVTTPSGPTGTASVTTLTSPPPVSSAPVVDEPKE